MVFLLMLLKMLSLGSVQKRKFCNHCPA